MVAQHATGEIISAMGGEVVAALFQAFHQRGAVDVLVIPAGQELAAVAAVLRQPWWLALYLAAAVAMATEAVPIIAWCSLPIDMARASRSMSPAFTGLPLDET